MYLYDILFFCLAFLLLLGIVLSILAHTIWRNR